MLAFEMSPTASSRQFLRRFGVYDRLKASWIYDLYWSLADPRVLADRAHEVTFYRRLLEGFEHGDLVFDIGANQGYKTDIFLRLGATVLAVDPDERNRIILADKFLNRRFVKRPVRIEAKAVSDTNTIATMWFDAPGSAKNTLNAKWVASLREDASRFGHTLCFGTTRNVATTTVEDLITRYGVPFFIKIDVEGHELSVLRGMTRPVRYLSFEVNLPEFTSEGLQCVDRLQELAPTGEFNYSPACRSSLVLSKWIPHREFRERYATIVDRSVEIFWRT